MSFRRFSLQLTKPLFDSYKKILKTIQLLIMRIKIVIKENVPLIHITLKYNFRWYLLKSVLL